MSEAQDNLPGIKDIVQHLGKLQETIIKQEEIIKQNHTIISQYKAEVEELRKTYAGGRSLRERQIKLLIREIDQLNENNSVMQSKLDVQAEKNKAVEINMQALQELNNIYSRRLRKEKKRTKQLEEHLLNTKQKVDDIFKVQFETFKYKLNELFSIADNQDLARPSPTNNEPEQEQNFKMLGDKEEVN